MIANSVIEEGKSCKYSDRFCELFERYQAPLARLVSSYATSAADREDLLQEIAAAIWRALPEFRGESSERTWLYRIAHNIAIRRSSQRRARSSREPSMDPAFDRAGSASSGEDAVLLDERRRALIRAIGELPLVDRQLVTLHLEGLSAAEIEEIMGCTAGAIATRLTRIRQRLIQRVQGGRVQ
jgi:RNA polymerase sigma-70 factor (ECF subfamily)